MDFLQRLRETYGDVSIGAIIVYKKNPPSAEVSVKAGSSLPPLGNLTPEPKVNEPIFDPYDPFGGIYSPRTPPTKPSLFPVNIADKKGWERLREEVMDLHELINFFAGKMDSQSPKFRKILDAYRNALEKSLAIPSEIDGDSSANFVDKLAEVIKKRFFTILKSYRQGIVGKGEQSKDYYRNLENRVKQYFERIGLKSDNVTRLSDFNDSRDRMNPTPIPAPSNYYNGKIAEVFVQPHYLEYHDDDGEVRKRWIDGECTVYKS